VEGADMDVRDWNPESSTPHKSCNSLQDKELAKVFNDQEKPA